MNLFFRDPGCRCAGTADTLRAALEERAVPPCPAHAAAPDLDAEARRTGLERLVAENRAATAAAEREASPPPSLGEVVGRLLAGDAKGLAPVRSPG